MTLNFWCSCFCLQCWYNRYTASQIYAVLRIDPRTSDIQGKHSTNWASAPAPTTNFCIHIMNLFSSHIICCVLGSGVHVLIWLMGRSQSAEICALYLVSRGNRTVHLSGPESVMEDLTWSSSASLYLNSSVPKLNSRTALRWIRNIRGWDEESIEAFYDLSVTISCLGGNKDLQWRKMG